MAPSCDPLPTTDNRPGRNRPTISTAGGLAGSRPILQNRWQPRQEPAYSAYTGSLNRISTAADNQLRPSARSAPLGQPLRQLVLVVLEPVDVGLRGLQGLAARALTGARLRVAREELAHLVQLQLRVETARDPRHHEAQVALVEREAGHQVRFPLRPEGGGRVGGGYRVRFWRTSML